MPPFPSVKTSLVDASHSKLHDYELPKKRGEDAKFLGSRPASLEAIDKQFCFAAPQYHKIENYISLLEDLAEERCK